MPMMQLYLLLKWQPFFSLEESCVHDLVALLEVLSGLKKKHLTYGMKLGITVHIFHFIRILHSTSFIRLLPTLPIYCSFHHSQIPSDWSSFHKSLETNGKIPFPHQSAAILQNYPNCWGIPINVETSLYSKFIVNH